MWGDDDPREFDMGCDAIGGSSALSEGPCHQQICPIDQHDVGRAAFVATVVCSPLRSVATRLIETEDVVPARSFAAPTHEPLPESVRLTVRVVVELVVEIIETVATTLLIADSSDTETCNVVLTHRVPLNRTMGSPTWGGRPTAPTSASVVIGAFDRMAAGTEKRPSGNVVVLE